MVRSEHMSRRTAASPFAAAAPKHARSAALRLPKGAGAYLMMAAIFLLATVMNVSLGIPVKRIMQGFSYDVLVILIVMELFTNLIATTGVMELLASRLAVLSHGRKRTCIFLFGALMFIISSLLNNITAVMVILPVIFVLLKALTVDRRYVSLFFGVILAISNLGGAASPIGDFPAITILSSGITSFLGYLTHAMPLFAFTALVLLLFWSRFVREDEATSEHSRQLAVSVLGYQYKNVKVRWDVLSGLLVIFAGMFLAWSLVPQQVIPPEMIAVLGYAAAAAYCALRGVKINITMELKSVLLIASFLYLAASVGQTGVLVTLANLLSASIPNPKLLLLVIMLVTSLVSGLVSAGPATAALMPVIIQLCSGAFAAQSDWIAVAFAASICAGSSLFMWSATAGFILSEKVNGAGLRDSGEHALTWNIASYLGYGVVNYLIQMAIAVAFIMVVV